MADRRIVVELGIDETVFTARMRDAAASIRRLLQVWRTPDMSQGWPSCTEDHELVFLGTQGGLTRPCPGCRAVI